MPDEPLVSDGSHSSGGRVLWGDRGPAYAQGWRDCAASLAAAFEKRAEGVAGGDRSILVRVLAPTLAAVFREAAEVARRQAQDGPGAPDGPDPAELHTESRTNDLSPADDMDPLFPITPEGKS